ncbi:hypothetical protein PHLGIDRAFT_285950 [Phlebiopsis gigantea 11061_1 CR5-6]|uniref:Uncharacterized protein n=1 Tax=Phlebiopsis gigantea (strain 11061_1 CR5-6) TaxID=745531 RepID=A0A0C3S0Q3_PHLG1|nr:hypothetical protein PHLGIDRAFT_285950 [Phlebiopsis gigantea 11061_1 CR5-6]
MATSKCHNARGIQFRSWSPRRYSSRKPRRGPRPRLEKHGSLGRGDKIVRLHTDFSKQTVWAPKNRQRYPGPVQGPSPLEWLWIPVLRGVKGSSFRTHRGGPRTTTGVGECASAAQVLPESDNRHLVAGALCQRPGDAGGIDTAEHRRNHSPAGRRQLRTFPGLFLELFLPMLKRFDEGADSKCR